MKEAEIRAAVVGRGLSRRGKNSYTQGAKRDQVARGWSDCSSFVRWCWKMVLGLDIGGNTEAQIVDADLVTIHKGGRYPDVSRIQPGDLVYFGGNAKHYLGVGHVEMVVKAGKSPADCQLLGHGSGAGPTLKNLKSYCDSRKNYLMTRRPLMQTRTWALGDRVIELGCFGEDVRALQAALMGLGYPVGASGADGDCGEATEAAIRRFQKAFGLVIDGQFGKKSCDALGGALRTGAAPQVQLSEADDPGEAFAAGDGDGEPPTDGAQEEAMSIMPAAHGSLATPIAGADGAMGAQNPYPVPASLKRRGSKGAAVKWIQWQLRCCGLDIGHSGTHRDGIDGDFGQKTDQAVRKFQLSRGLYVDGEVGKQTRAALERLVENGEDAASSASSEPAGRIYDVSSYDGDIDFGKVSGLSGQQRCEMMIIRAQASKADAKLSRNIKGCEKVGIAYGVYAYTYAATPAQGRADAERFYANVRAANGHPLCWVIDAEEGKNTRASVEAMRERLRALIGEAAAIWFYSFDSKVRAWADLMKNYDAVWSARWNNPDIAPGYKDYDVWQYGYSAVAGIRKTTDTSRVHPEKTLAAILRRRAKGE